MNEEKLIYALSCIASYNGHIDWLMNLVDDLDRSAADAKFLTCPIPFLDWGTERHCIWELLVGLFGNWGTSIRGGWIENTADAASFIRRVCAEDLDLLEKNYCGRWQYKDGDAE